MSSSQPEPQMPTEVAHQLFYTPELVSIICEYVRRESDLNRLARTSKVFLEPSLDILWREKRSLTSLIRCFPPSLLEEGENGSLKFKRAIKPLDKKRFEFYAKRVRSLIIPEMLSKEHDRVDESVYSALNASCFGECLFPKLRRLVLHLDYEAQEFSIPMLNMFLNKNLEELVLDPAFHQDLVNRLTFMQHLHIRCPDIRVFEICESFISDPGFSEAVCIPLLQWKNLKHLSLSCMPTLEAMIHLAKLDKLEVLNIDAVDEPEVDVLCLQTDEAIFQSLESLDISSGPKFCRDLLKATSNSPLRAISAQINLDGEQYGVEIRNSIYASAQSHKGLERLQIWEDFGFRTQSLLGPTQIEDIEGFLTLSRLEHFVLRLEGGTDLDDNNLKEIAQAFPNLEVLRLGLLGGDVPMDNPSTLNLDLSPCRVTLTGVTSLIELCPNLIRIHLRFDARTVPDDPPDHISSRRISMLEVDDCPISAASVQGVATYFSRLFPLLKRIGFEDEDVDNENAWVDRKIVENWRQVDKMLKEMHTQNLN